ncbi:MAG TPA: histidine kinase [Xanthomonadales bacterium]|nr:histidine kinase [Xanthomonadales bacterium]
MLKKWLNDPQHLFWVLQLGGWGSWGFCYKYWGTRLSLGEVAPDYGLYVLVITVIAVVLTLGLRLLFKLLWNSAIWLQVLGFLGGSAAAGYIWISARGEIYSGWIEKAKDMEEWYARMGAAAEIYEKVSFYEGNVSSIALILAWSSLYFAIKYYRVFQDMRESALKSAAMAHEAQLKMLRYQLNPHFLFNTLNAISTLILEKDNELANRMVTRLSSFLRYSLDNDPMQKITLQQEISALQLYLDIEKVRFEDRLNLELDISAEAQQAMIPSLLLQPLIENAIKYGIARSEEGGTLRIAAKVFAGDLLIQLSDDGPGCSVENGQIPAAKGVGLRNTRERLAELYGHEHGFRLSKTEPHGLTISIRIPFEKR